MHPELPQYRRQCLPTYRPGESKAAWNKRFERIKRRAWGFQPFRLIYENQMLDIVYVPNRQAAFHLVHELLERDLSIEVLSVFDNGERLAHYRTPALTDDSYQIIVVIHRVNQ